MLQLSLLKKKVSLSHLVQIPLMFSKYSSQNQCYINKTLAIKNIQQTFLVVLTHENSNCAVVMTAFDHHKNSDTQMK